MSNYTLVGDSKRSGPPKSGQTHIKSKNVSKRMVLPIPSEESLVAGCIDALFVLLRTFGYVTEANESCRDKSVKHWLKGSQACGSDGWMKFAKYKFAAYFYHRAGVQMGEKPDIPWVVGTFQDLPNKLLCGRAGKFCDGLSDGRYDIVGSSKTSDEFLASLLQVKKGCPRPTEKMVQSAALKTFEALTKNREPLMGVELIQLPKSWADANEIELMFDELKEQNEFGDKEVIAECVRTVKELFHGQRFTDFDRYAGYFPTTKASFETSQAKGGGVREISRVYANLYPEGDNEIKGLHMFQGRLDDRDLMARAQMGREPFMEPLNIVRGKSHFEFNFLEQSERQKQLYLENVKLAVDLVEKNENFAVPVGLAEALKVRIITKGRASLQHALKPLQKFMHGILRKHPTFELIGTPVTPFLVNERLGAQLPEDEFLNSGDYSAATNELRSFASEAVAHAIADEVGLTNNERIMFLASLTGHMILDPSSSKGSRTYKRQRNGQLMGSVVSFPVLCIVNAALTRRALELGARIHRHKLGLRPAPKSILLRNTSIMINGDDVLSRMNRTQYEFWLKMTAQAGLSSSVGKTFLCRQFAQINSVNFVRLDTPIPYLDYKNGRVIVRDLWYKETSYVNLGLLMGLKRSGEVALADITDPTDSLGSRCRELISAAPVAFRPSLMKEFLRLHNHVLSQVRVPHYLPESWGGVGLPRVFEGDTMIFGPTSDLDQRVAARILESPDLYPVSRIPAMVSWKVHEKVMKDVKLMGLPIGILDDLGSNQWRAVYKRLTISQLYRSGVDAIFDEYEDGELSAKHRRITTQILRRNERTWKKALHSTRSGQVLPPPLSWNTIEAHTPPELGPSVRILESQHDEIAVPIDGWLLQMEPADLWN
jgi:hypothetical protein